MLGTARQRGAVLAAAVVAAAVAGMAWAGTGGGDGGGRVEARGDPEAVRALAAARAAMARAPSFRYRFQGFDATMAEWDEGGRRFTGEGAWSAGRWRLLTRDRDDVSETIVDGDTVYNRWPDPGHSLAREPWASWPSSDEEPLPRSEVLDEMSSALAEEANEEGGRIDSGFVDQLAVALAAGLYLEGTPERVDWADLEVEVWPLPGDPTSFAQAIGRGTAPRLLGRAGGKTTLGLTLRAPDDVVDAFGGPVPDGRLELDLGPDHLPTALRLHVGRGDQTFDVAVRLSHWGEPVTVAVPAAG